MSLREFIASIWRNPRKRYARANEEWLTIAERLQELQGQVGAPSTDASVEDHGQHSAKSDERTGLVGTLRWRSRISTASDLICKGNLAIPGPLWRHF